MEYKVNKIYVDDFGRKSGVIAVDKPVGKTSHDIVYAVRKALNMQKVGHAGALDPAASGLLIILAGKATKQSDEYLTMGKEYLASILFGISTDSADREGEILHTQVAGVPSDLSAVIQQFSPEYKQYVPIFSSVKVDGEKLRVRARQADSFEVVERAGKRYALFHKGEKTKEIELPLHVCKLPMIEIENTAEIDIASSDFFKKNEDKLSTSKFPGALIRVACSKGTYIRTLAEDIGQALTPPVPAMLWNLRRTKVGEITIEQAISPDDLQNLAY
ncbi:tRNA pseudouridine(55) synthase TruB [Candidatus Dojkabacteria bacterium]|uniref:tRNA pseudouridine synthase B n=1 Tax=Candidatus Dojkabacteria bacterium TaxID=2099670 RepID=A0A955I588_9BACT|nr:tRNA pseudouridine(55) synthase TruB [Candidatus Dojkabacteria bacterium]